MLRKRLTGLAAGAGVSLALALPVNAQELTIFWAEWDPANYLQELVNEYTAETGVTVIVETTPWPDFQTKTFAELNARGDAYDMVVGDSQWLGAASTGGHYVDLTDFYAEHGVNDIMTKATVTYYAEYPKDSGTYWSIPAEGDANGWAYRKDWFEDPAEMDRIPGIRKPTEGFRFTTCQMVTQSRAAGFTLGITLDNLMPGGNCGSAPRPCRAASAPSNGPSTGGCSAAAATATR